MKIDMHLFCLIGALATGITDGRISSSSQPVGGSAMEVTPPNQRELEPAIEYCTAIDRKTGDGKQRGVVDWQGIDQCNKCAGGQPWWPCAGGNFCTGACTPEAVCKERLNEERLKVAAEAAASDELIATLENENDSLRACIVDCVDGYERGTNVTCTEACAGQCCGITGKPLTDTCAGFTGLVHRDDSCTGNGAFKRKDTIIAENDEEIADQKKIIQIYIAFLDAVGRDNLPGSLCGFALQFEERGFAKGDAATLLDCTTSPTASPIEPPICGVDSYLSFENCFRCDARQSPKYGTSTCGSVGATSNDQCKYPIGTCVFDVIKKMMVFGEDIPIKGIYQGNSCDTQALQQYTCGGEIYDPRDDCPEANTKEDFDACGAECIWTTTEIEPTGPERLCIPAQVEAC